VLLGFGPCSRDLSALVPKHDSRLLPLAPQVSYPSLRHGTASEGTGAGPRQGAHAHGTLRGHWGKPRSLRRPSQLGHWLPPWGLQALLWTARRYTLAAAPSIWRGKSLHLLFYWLALGCSQLKQLYVTDAPSEIASWSLVPSAPTTTLQSHSRLRHQQPRCFGTKLLASHVTHHISHLTHVKQTPRTGMRQAGRNNLTIQ